MAREFKILDLDVIRELPWSVWLEWFEFDQVEPFPDRRGDMRAFLLARVLRGVVYEQIEPTPEMFNLSEPVEPEAIEDEDGPPPDRIPNLIAFRANMARAGFPTYFESATVDGL